MKKLLALVIALAMVLSLATVLVSAEDEPDAYLVLVNDGSGSVPCINYAFSGELLNGNYTVDVEALVCFEGCESDGGSAYLNCYPYNGNTLLSWEDYAKHTVQEDGVWTKVEKTGWVLSKNDLDPDKVSMGIGFWQARGTIKVAYIKVSQNGEVVWSVDYANGLDLDAEDITLHQDITEDTKGTAWYLVGVTEPVEESTPASEPEDLENIAAGKSYTVSGNTLRGDGWDDADGTKLTDGVYATDGSTDFFGMKGTLPDPQDADVEVDVDIVLDLGEVRNFSKITADASYGDWGISAPGGVRFAVSEDGENFTEVGNATSGESLDGFSGNWVGTLYSAEGNLTGRYVKVTYYKQNDGQSNHIWISEIEVLAEGEPAPVEESTPAEESKPVTPTTGDAGIIALAAVSVIALGGAVIVKKSK